MYHNPIVAAYDRLNTPGTPMHRVAALAELCYRYEKRLALKRVMSRAQYAVPYLRMHKRASAYSFPGGPCLLLKTVAHLV